VQVAHLPYQKSLSCFCIFFQFASGLQMVTTFSKTDSNHSSYPSESDKVGRNAPSPPIFMCMFDRGSVQFTYIQTSNTQPFLRYTVHTRSQPCREVSIGVPFVSHRNYTWYWYLASACSFERNSTCSSRTSRAHAESRFIRMYTAGASTVHVRAFCDTKGQRKSRLPERQDDVPPLACAH